MAMDVLDAAKTQLIPDASKIPNAKIPNAQAARTHARARGAWEIRNAAFHFDSVHLTAQDYHSCHDPVSGERQRRLSALIFSPAAV
jgi:hypothetical protein